MSEIPWWLLAFQCHELYLEGKRSQRNQIDSYVAYRLGAVVWMHGERKSKSLNNATPLPIHHKANMHDDSFWVMANQ